MRTIFFVLVLIHFLGCNKTNKTPNFVVEEIADYTYSEKHKNSLEFKVDKSLFIISELNSMIDSLNNKKSILKKVGMNSIAEPELVFENQKLTRILDSLQFETNSNTPKETTGTSFNADNNQIFFRQEYSIQLGENTKIKARIYGLNENSSLKIYSGDTLTKEIKLPDAPNYLIKTIDINNDKLNEILIYSTLVNSMVNLKILSILEENN